MTIRVLLRIVLLHVPGVFSYILPLRRIDHTPARPYPAPPCSTLIYHYSNRHKLWPYSNLLDITLLYPNMILILTQRLPYHTLLYSTRRCSDSTTTLLYSTLLYATLPYSILLSRYATLLHSYVPSLYSTTTLLHSSCAYPILTYNMTRLYSAHAPALLYSYSTLLYYLLYSTLIYSNLLDSSPTLRLRLLYSTIYSTLWYSTPRQL